MKKLLLRLLLFAIPLYAIASLVDVLYSNQAKHIVSGNSKVWNDIFDGKISEECLIYGSSRAAVHIDPQMIEEQTSVAAYNFGLPGQVFTIQNIRHEENLKHNPQPKYILYSLDFFTLAKSKGVLDYDQFLPYLFYNASIYDTMKDYFDDKMYFLEYYLPLFRYREKSYIFYKIIAHILSRSKYALPNNKGYSSVNVAWADNMQIPQLQNIDVYDIDNETKQKFEDFIEDCKSKNIKLALIYTHEHSSLGKTVAKRDSIVNVYGDIALKHNIPYLDYTKDSINSDTTYFWNALHLNAKGSKHLTQRIIDDLNAQDFFNK